MSKINAVRFINLNYNNNAMKIIEKWRRQDGSRTDDDGSFCA